MTVEVLSGYAKSWEKASNICASEELISEELSKIQESHQIFAAPNIPFPQYLTTNAIQLQPSESCGVIENEYHGSLLSDLPLSCAPPLPIPSSFSNLESSMSSFANTSVPNFNAQAGYTVTGAAASLPRLDPEMPDV